MIKFITALPPALRRRGALALGAALVTTLGAGGVAVAAGTSGHTVSARAMPAGATAVAFATGPGKGRGPVLGHCLQLQLLHGAPRTVHVLAPRAVAVQGRTGVTPAKELRAVSITGKAICVNGGDDVKGLRTTTAPVTPARQR